MRFVGLSSLASLSLGIQLLALVLLSGPSSLLVSAQEHIYNGFEYAIKHGHQNWTDHEKAAMAWGGHLASVHSEDEYDFILNLLDAERKYFLGGVRIPGRSTGSGNETWEWSDGSPWDYTAWAEGEPSNTNDSEDRVEILMDGTWSDVASRDERPAIYKRKVALTAAPSSVKGPTASPAAALPTPSPVVPAKKRSSTNSGTRKGMIFLYLLCGWILYLAVAFLLCRNRTIQGAPIDGYADSADDDANTLDTPLL